VLHGQLKPAVTELSLRRLRRLLRVLQLAPGVRQRLRLAGEPCVRVGGCA
jgi:hypothetical protein